MHIFDYIDTPRKLLTPEIVNLLSSLHEFRGKQGVYLDKVSDTVTALLDIAKIQSTKASNKIEGIYTSDERLEALVMEKTTPHNRSEEEIAGYREVLAAIHNHYEYMSVRPGIILQLHRDLYSYRGGAVGGAYKIADNVIAETDEEGKQIVRFVPTPAFQTSEAVERLCTAFNTAMERSEYDPLLLIAMFVIDFLCIHPFNDGNGRMSRLLTLLLLYRADYLVGKYISIEMLIERTKESYYEALQMSSTNWHENGSDYVPFVRYFLGVVVKAYGEFQDRVEHLRYHKMTKSERVQRVFETRYGVVRKSDIVRLCPDISVTTIERTLNALLDSGYLTKVGKGRSVGYVKR